MPYLYVYMIKYSVVETLPGLLLEVLIASQSEKISNWCERYLVGHTLYVTCN